MKKSKIIKSLIVFVISIIMLLVFGLSASEYVFNNKIIAYHAKYDIMFKPSPETNLKEMDEKFKKEYSDYRGYVYSQNILSANLNNKKNQDCSVYLASPEILSNKFGYWNLVKGKQIESQKLESNYVPVLVSGKKLSNTKIGARFDIKVKSDVSNEVKIVKAEVVGIVNNLAEIQEYKKRSFENYVDYSEALIIMPDSGEYNDMFVGGRQKYVLKWKIHLPIYKEAIKEYGAMETEVYGLAPYFDYNPMFYYTDGYVVIIVSFIVGILMLIFAILPYIIFFIKKIKNKFSDKEVKVYEKI